MKSITYIPQEIDIDDILSIKNVCAYCRVSHDLDDQHGSLENQITHYNTLIENNPYWRKCGVYAEKCSGKSIQNRSQFKQLIDECRQGNIDIIITKSISRFSRNALDLIVTCRELYHLGVDVWFETEGIKLLSLDSMFILETYAAIAQEENRSRSEDIKWGIKAGFENGKIGYTNFICYGYIKGVNGLEIHKEQAKVVRLIFKWRLSGKSLGEISKELYKRKIRSPTGKEVWSRETINKLLKNEKVCGNVLLQKTFVENYLEGKPFKNKGQIRKVLIRDNHKGIVSNKAFIAVNSIFN